MATEFDKIKDIAGWRDKLDELLEAARDAAKDDNLDTRLEVADRLTQFIVNNPPAQAGDPATQEYDDMDRVAREAHDSLLLATIQQRVAGIMSQTAELAALRKKVEGRTSADLNAAASIRLEKARRVIESTTTAVAAMMDLKKEVQTAVDAGIKNADFVAIGKQLDDLIESMQSLRNDVETTF